VHICIEENAETSENIQEKNCKYILNNWSVCNQSGKLIHFLATQKHWIPVVSCAYVCVLQEFNCQFGH
jgi:hypothetical protein